MQRRTTSARSLDDPTWTSRSTAAEDLTPRFSFCLSKSVYVGDPNSSEQIHSGEYDRPLHLPSLAARDRLAPTAAEVIGREAELAAYYRQVMTIEGKRPASGAVGYWLRFDLVSATAGQGIGFPWWDRVADAAPFFEWLRTVDAGEFFDADQGWMLTAAARAQHLHFQHSDLETQEEFANLSVDRAAFLDRLRVAEEEVRQVIAVLRTELGVDPWS
jgi:hypothetical protein